MVMTSEQLSQEAVGLLEGHFSKVSANGFGDPYNAYPHSMAWFRDRLYVGTSRNNFVMVKVTVDDGVRLANLPVWPVNTPDNLQDTMRTLRAEIWRHDPVAGDWERVYRAPMVDAPSGLEVPSCVSFRTMAVFQGKSDDEPALYVPTRPTSHTPETVMLRSGDGEHFEVVSEPGLGLPDPKPKGVRALTSFKGRLFAAPAEGPARGRGNIAAVMLIMVSDDPARGQWTPACEPGFGDPTNKTVFALAPLNGYLYAGTVNIAQGYQVWKTEGEGKPPFRWERVLSHGAFRGPLNQIAMTMAPFGGHLYVGSAIQGFRDHENNVGPAPPEVVRVHPDDSWDLVAGEPKDTPDGFKAPLSGLGPGFGRQSAGYIWQMCVHDGCLYVGNSVWTLLLKYSDLERWPRDFREMFSKDSLESYLRENAGFDLWRTADGVSWHAVTRNGFGNHCNIGCRTMMSTAHGLYVGAVNPFGPEMAVQREGGWRYELNDMSGLEIWRGNRQAAETREPVSPSRASTSSKRAVAPSPRGAKPEEQCERLIREYYGNSGFRLCGYWACNIDDARAACENLMEEVLSLFPDRRGRVCDVGCGLGATTNYLLRHFPVSSVAGLVADRKELRRCRENVPEVEFVVSKLPRLTVDSCSFDKAICMEVAGRLPGPGGKLWRELYRVLTPGGQVVGSDFIHATAADNESPGIGAGADAADRYGDLLRCAGFADVRVIDVSSQCWAASLKHRKQYFWTRQLSLEAEPDLIARVLDDLPGAAGSVSQYILFSATKPADSDGMEGVAL